MNITQTLNQRIDSLYRHISLIENTFILNPARKYPQIEEIKDAIGKGIWDDFLHYLFGLEASVNRLFDYWIILKAENDILDLFIQSL